MQFNSISSWSAHLTLTLDTLLTQGSRLLPQCWPCLCTLPRPPGQVLLWIPGASTKPKCRRMFSAKFTYYSSNLPLNKHCFSAPLKLETNSRNVRLFSRSDPGLQVIMSLVCHNQPISTQLEPPLWKISNTRINKKKTWTEATCEHCPKSYEKHVYLMKHLTTHCVADNTSHLFASHRRASNAERQQN